MADSNTKAVLVGVNEIALQLIAGMKDGVFGDIKDFWARLHDDTAFQAKLAAAYGDLQAAQGELPSLSPMDYLDLAQTELSYVPQLISAVHGTPPTAPK